MFRPLIAASALALAAAAAQAETFSFVVLGDAPYGAPEEVNPLFETLIDQINAVSPDLVIHVGDTKSGSTQCDDAMLDQQLSYLDAFSAPTLYTPGDNEWTDCHRANAGGFNPLERLAYIRETYFSDPATSFGARPVAVESQAEAGYPENTRMMHKGVMFVATHVVGSNNNFEVRDMAEVEEFMARDAANIAWLNASFDAAGAADALVLAIHADMFEFDFDSFGKEGFLRHSGFLNFGNALKEAANAFGKPVLLTFGDSHVFRVFRPFAETAPMITAMETFGAGDMHAVEVSVDTEASYPFAMRPIINQGRPIAATN